MDIWNGAFQQIPDEPIKSRSYLYASELGTPFIEAFLKMKGTPFTNTFSGTNRCKMEVGKLMESIVRFVLKRAGIMKAAQKTVDHQISGLLEVHGRLDFIAGGAVDLQQAETCTSVIKILFQDLEYPPIFAWIADQTLNYARKLAGRSNEPLELYVMEVKSLSDFVYRMLEQAVRAMNFHHVQVYHYLLGENMKIGKVTYISREDARLMEKTVPNNKESHREYENWITEITDYYRSNTRPPLEPLMVFNEDTCSFNKNTIGVEWSKYLKLLYGFETGQDYRNYAMPKVESWNRVYKRCVGCQNMTAANKEHIAEAKKLFPDWDRLVDLGKLKGVTREENQEAAA